MPTTSSCNLSAMRSLSISSASKPISSTSPLIFSKYLSASLRRRSAPVSSSSSDSLLISSSSPLGFRCLAPSSDPLLEIDSSRLGLAGLAFCVLEADFMSVARFFEGTAAMSSRLRFRCEAGVVKKEDIEKLRFPFLPISMFRFQNFLIVVCARNLGDGFKVFSSWHSRLNLPATARLLKLTRSSQA